MIKKNMGNLNVGILVENYTNPNPSAATWAEWEKWIMPDGTKKWRGRFNFSSTVVINTPMIAGVLYRAANVVGIPYGPDGVTNLHVVSGFCSVKSAGGLFVSSSDISSYVARFGGSNTNAYPVTINMNVEGTWE